MKLIECAREELNTSLHVYNRVDRLAKVKLTLTVEEEVIKKAKKLGLNLSQVAENAFLDMIKRIERGA